MAHGSAAPSPPLDLRAATPVRASRGPIFRALCCLPLLAFAPCRGSRPATPVDPEAPAVVVTSPAPGVSADDAADAGPDAPSSTDVLAPDGEPDASLVDDGIAADPESAIEVAARLVREAVVIDLHADVVYQVADRRRDFAAGDGQWTLERARRGGQDAQFFPLWLPRADADRPASLKRHALVFQTMLESTGGALVLVRTSAELRERAARGELSALLGLEGADGLGDDPRNLDPYAALGLRYLGLTWNDSNAFAEAAAEPREPPGLTDAGRALVGRANDAGVLLDLAHASAATFWDVHRLSRSPLLVSHAALRARHDHSRNIDDLQLLALVRTGGVLGLVWHSGFLAELPEGTTRAPLAALLAHYDHARALGAVDALAVGSDLDGGIRPPEGLDTIAALPVLAAALLERGWDEAELRGVLGENVLRLLDAADAAVDGPRPAREWPAELACAGAPSGKEDRQLADRLVLAGPKLGPETTLTLRWEHEAADGATLEAWGEPGTRLAVYGAPERADAADGGADADAAELLIGSAGSGRCELTASQRAARRVTLTVLPRAVRDAAPEPEAAVRLDELAVWLR